MDIATSTISILDLLNVSRDIAQLNASYLGISVVILGSFGGIFVYINLKPIREMLNKQEKTISDLKDEADGLLDESKKQTGLTLEDFKATQEMSLQKLLGEKYIKITAETKEVVLNYELVLFDKVDKLYKKEFSDFKSELIMTAKNQILESESKIQKNINIEDKITAEKLEKLKNENATLKSDLSEMQIIVKELEVEKFEKNGQQGAILRLIELLKIDIDRNYDWSIASRLINIKKYLKEHTVRHEVNVKLNIELARLDTNVNYKTQLSEIRSAVKLLEE